MVKCPAVSGIATTPPGSVRLGAHAWCLQRREHLQVYRLADLGGIAVVPTTNIGEQMLSSGACASQLITRGSHLFWVTE
jgi:hypothetical protein